MKRHVYFFLALLGMGLMALGCAPRSSEEGGTPGPFASKRKPPPPKLPEKESASKAKDVKLTIVKPQEGEIYQTEDGTVQVQLALENYEIEEGGQHLHVILDNEAYKAHYDLNAPCVFEDVEPGWHSLRAFPSRPWHESIKPQFSPEAFQMVQFFVVPKSQIPFDPTAPLLTYSRPQGVYEGRDAQRILLDFQVVNCELSEEGYRVRYLVVPAAPEEPSKEPEAAPSEDAVIQEEEAVLQKEEKTAGSEERHEWTYITSWPPAPGEKLHVIENLKPGDWTVILELVDENDQLVSANGWNHTERTITVK